MINKKIIIAIILTPFFVLFLYYIGWSFSPGSYSRAKTYELDIPEKTLINAIKNLKRNNPEYSVPNISYPNGGKDSLIDTKKGHWHSFYFYYSDKNQIIHTLTRQHTKTSTSFLFNGINDGLVLGNWNNVNESFWFWKNSEKKIEFEERILNKLKKEIEAQK